VQSALLQPCSRAPVKTRVLARSYLQKTAFNGEYLPGRSVAHWAGSEPRVAMGLFDGSDDRNPGLSRSTPGAIGVATKREDVNSWRRPGDAGSRSSPTPRAGRPWARHSRAPLNRQPGMWRGCHTAGGHPTEVDSPTTRLPRGDQPGTVSTGSPSSRGRRGLGGSAAGGAGGG
jgi:hypothetical protein